MTARYQIEYLSTLAERRDGKPRRVMFATYTRDPFWRRHGFERPCWGYGFTTDQGEAGAWSLRTARQHMATLAARPHAGEYRLMPAHGREG